MITSSADAHKRPSHSHSIHNFNFHMFFLQKKKNGKGKEKTKNEILFIWLISFNRLTLNPTAALAGQAEKFLKY